MAKLKVELLKRMKEQGITKAELSRRMEVSRASVSQFFNNRQKSNELGNGDKVCKSDWLQSAI